MAFKLRRAPLFGLDNPLRIPALPKYSSPPATGAGCKFPKSPPHSTPPPSSAAIGVSNHKTQVEHSTKSRTPHSPTATTTATATQTLAATTSAATKSAATAAAATAKHGSGADRSVGVKHSGSPAAAPSSGRISAVTQLKASAIRHTKDSMEVGVAYSSQQRGGRVGASPDRGRGSPKGSLHVDFAAPGEMKERKEKYLTAKYGAHQMALIRKRLGVEMWMFDQLQVLYPPKDGKSEEKEVDLDELLDLEDESKRRQFLRGRLSDCQLPQDLVEKFIDELMERATML